MKLWAASLLSKLIRGRSLHLSLYMCVYHYICLCQDWLEVRALYLSLYLRVSLYLSLYLCIYLCQDWLGRRASLLDFSDFDCRAHFFVRGLMGGDYPLLGDAGWAHKTLHYALCTINYALCTKHYVLTTRGRWLGPKDLLALWWEGVLCFDYWPKDLIRRVGNFLTT